MFLDNLNFPKKYLAGQSGLCIERVSLKIVSWLLVLGRSRRTKVWKRGYRKLYNFDFTTLALLDSQPLLQANTCSPQYSQIAELKDEIETNKKKLKPP